MNYRDPEIIVFCGPMRSGKSNELLQVLDKLKYSQIPYMVFKPNVDTRTPGLIATRYLKHSEAAIEIDSKNPSEILEKIDLDNLKLPFFIAIDETQFFDLSLVDVVKKLNSKGIGFVLAGLDLDAKGKTFGAMGSLLAMATVVKKLTAVCQDCFSSATRTGLNKPDPSFDENNIKIEDSGTFGSFCQRCFYKKLNQ